MRMGTGTGIFRVKMGQGPGFLELIRDRTRVFRGTGTG